MFRNTHNRLTQIQNLLSLDILRVFHEIFTTMTIMKCLFQPVFIKKKIMFIISEIPYSGKLTQAQTIVICFHEQYPQLLTSSFM